MSLEPDVLSKALERVGANRWMRGKYYECSMIRCVGDVFLALNEDGEYSYPTPSTITQRFGSFIEGTTTIGMGSDIDEIDVELNEVIEEAFEGTHEKNVNTIVLETDMFTPPGFVKLKVDPRGNYKDFIIKHDCAGKSFMSNVYTEDYKQHTAVLLQAGQDPTDLEKHGPALTNFNEPENQIESIDAIIAFHCKTSLTFTQEFFNRVRHYGWPHPSDLDKMRGQGCLLVPTGHSRCDNKFRTLQWRISFSFQERQLMLNMNDAQYKCYVLLKLMKKAHVSPIVGLTSYHCKTALFYTIENTPSVIWTEENLLNCFIQCLKTLRRWTSNKFCPNYFLPELNLFTGKIGNHDMPKLIRILTSIINNPIEGLQRIQTDHFGKLVKLYAEKTKDDENIEDVIDTNVANKLHKLLVDITNSVLSIKNTVLRKISYKCNDLDEIISRHSKWLETIKSLQANNEIGPYHLDGIEWAFPHVCKFLHSSLASHLAIKALETVEKEKLSFDANEKVTETAQNVAETENDATSLENPGTETKGNSLKRKQADLKTKKIFTVCWLMLQTTYHFWKGIDSDALSSKLKLATFLMFTGNLDLTRFRADFIPTFDIQSLCACTTSCRGNLIRENDYPPFRKMFKLSPLDTLKMCTSEYIQKCVNACTIFLPTESKITCYPLKFEMHRSFGSAITYFDEYQQTSANMSNSEFDNCATLDSKIYYALLTVLMADNGEERAKNIRYLQSSCNFDTLAHRESTYNLIGWIVSADTINEKSLYFFKESWKYNIEQQHYKLPALASYDKNAAKWHLALLLFRVWIYRQRVNSSSPD